MLTQNQITKIHEFFSNDIIQLETDDVICECIYLATNYYINLSSIYAYFKTNQSYRGEISSKCTIRNHTKLLRARSTQVKRDAQVKKLQRADTKICTRRKKRYLK